MHKGPRVAGGEYFDDVVLNTGIGGLGSDAGILHGRGLDDYDGLTEQVLPEGVQVEMNCRRCNRKQGIVLEWPEIFIVASNTPQLPPIAPRGWMYSPNNGTVALIQRCPGCGAQEGLALHVSPQEARTYLKSASEAGIVTKEQLHVWGQGVAGLRAQHR
jgi:hypothetical protein